jgi:RHS repeat-associated protein
VNGNISTRTGGPYGDAIFTHDWRDRLASVEQGSTTTDILVDPLGRMVAKVKHTADGDVARAYVHDGDQVAVEYVQPAGSTNWQPERRHLWSTWIDQLAVEQIDTDGDGSLETTLYPITDMLGSVQLLTDDTGTIVERIKYDPDGTPHFWSADTQAPAVNRVVWTGDGTTPTGAVTPQVFEIGFSEVIDAASVSGASATLTPEGGQPVSLTLTLAADGRAAELTGATITAGVNYALHVEGLKDPSGNALQPEDRMLVVADDQVFEVLTDTVPPLLVAVMDAVDGVYLLFDEAVVGNGGDLAAAVTINRQGVAVAGETTRVEANVLKWTPAETTTWLLAAQYALSGINVEDLGGNAVDAASMSFTHLAVVDGQLLIARQAATESVPMGASTYGVTSLFQGRTWHSDLGMYYYRARWYLPEGGVFGERDPVGYLSSPDSFSFENSSPLNFGDPRGLWAWKKTREWDALSEYQYSEYVKARASDYEAGKATYRRCTCEDFAINLLIDFASQNGLPVRLISRPGLVFDSRSMKFHGVAEFRDAVNRHFGAGDVRSAANTESILPGIPPGDLFLLAAARPGDLVTYPEHIQVVTDVTATTVQIHQGNLATAEGGRVYWRRSDPSPQAFYVGYPVRRGDYEKSSGSYRRSGNPYQRYYFRLNKAEVRIWRFAAWNLDPVEKWHWGWTEVTPPGSVTVSP